MASIDSALLLTQTLRGGRIYLVSACFFSLAINLLYLAAPLYMLQVYDRAVPSGSSATLVLLSVILVGAFVTLGVLELARGRILTRLGLYLENALGRSLSSKAFAESSNGGGHKALQDFDALRRTIAGPSIYPVFDLPCTPIFVVAAFLLHPWLGAFTLICLLVLVGLAALNQHLLLGVTRAAAASTLEASRFGEAVFRQGAIMNVLGMAPYAAEKWRQRRRQQLEQQRQVSDRSSAMGALTKSLRLCMQSLALGLGAALVIAHESSAGSIFAASLLLARALQPVEQLIGSWGTLAAARSAYGRLAVALAADDQPAPAATELPAPAGHLTVENAHLSLPGIQRLLLRNINCDLPPGTALGVVGPSGAGKSLLGEMLVGARPCSMGAVRLDGVLITPKVRHDFGRHIGYMPQRVDLLEETVAANIGRLMPGADADIVEAARLAGAHQAILRLPDGYDTVVSDSAAELPGGLRQSIGFARAIFRAPALVVLDEPAANLDSEGDADLGRCLNQLKQRGCTLVVINPRGSSMASMDMLLFLRNGAMEMLGARDAVLQQLGMARPAVGRPSLQTAVTANG